MIMHGLRDFYAAGKAPSSKLQASREAPNPKLQRVALRSILNWGIRANYRGRDAGVKVIHLVVTCDRDLGAWCLKFLWSLELGA
jgi:hypothetical protein